MPNKKTGARKKAEKQREVQKKIRSNMQCEHCGREQKIRAFCYFCARLNKTKCVSCGREQCSVKNGDCMIKHTGKCATGLHLLGAVCTHCEGFICHSKKCISTHPCKCPLHEGKCMECKRTVSQHGGRMHRCSCQSFLCEDDRLEHQSNCQVLDSENLKCMSCNRFGMYTCLKCKICCCIEHVRRKGFTYKPKMKELPCPKCGNPISETKMCSISARKHDYGRQPRAAHKNGGKEKAGNSKKDNKNEDGEEGFRDNEDNDEVVNHHSNDGDVNHDDGKDKDIKHNNEDVDVNNDGKDSEAEHTNKQNGDEEDGNYDDGDDDASHDGDNDVHDDKNNGVDDDNDGNGINRDHEE